MRRILFSALFLCCSYFYINAQQVFWPLEWNIRSLKLEDFATSISINDSISNTAVSWELAKKKSYSSACDNLTISRIAFRNVFLPANSWIKEGYRNADQLKYEQLKFDLSELWCRRAEQEANFSGNCNKSVKDYKDSLRTSINRLKLLSRNGTDRSVVDSISINVASLLAKEEDDASLLGMPETKAWSFGIGIIPDIKIRTGSISKLLPTPTPFLSFDFSLGYGSLFLTAGASAQISSGWLHTKEVFQFDGNVYPAGLDCEDINYYAYCSYIAYRNGRFSISPLIGCGFTSIDFREDEYDSFGGLQYMAGVSADWDLHHLWIFHKKEIDSYTVRTMAYITKDNPGNGYSGYSINLGIGLSGRFQRTK